MDQASPSLQGSGGNIFLKTEKAQNFKMGRNTVQNFSVQMLLKAFK
jgi:hypothetical protein